MKSSVHAAAVSLSPALLKLLTIDLNQGAPGRSHTALKQSSCKGLVPREEGYKNAAKAGFLGKKARKMQHHAGRMDMAPWEGPIHLPTQGKGGIPLALKYVLEGKIETCCFLGIG